MSSAPSACQMVSMTAEKPVNWAWTEEGSSAMTDIAANTAGFQNEVEA